LFTQASEYSVPEISIKNFPNPFAEITLFDINIGISDNYDISILNSNGELIKSFGNRFLKTGKHNFTWDRRNELGNRVPGGLYYCMINSGRTKKSLKLIVQ